MCRVFDLMFFFFYCRFDVLSGQNRVVVDTVEGKNG